MFNTCASKSVEEETALWLSPVSSLLASCCAPTCVTEWLLQAIFPLRFPCPPSAKLLLFCLIPNARESQWWRDLWDSALDTVVKRSASSTGLYNEWVVHLNAQHISQNVQSGVSANIAKRVEENRKQANIKVEPQLGSYPLHITLPLSDTEHRRCFDCSAAAIRQQST